jgi:hypothetical protein
MSEKKLNWIAFGKGSDEGEIDAIPKDKADKILEAIKRGMEKAKRVSQPAPASQLSIADELAKIAKLKEQGVLSEAEFLQMKQELLKKL